MKKLLRNATLLLALFGLVAGAYAQSCEPITISTTTTLSENFDGYSGGASSDYTNVGSTILPPCWNSIAAQPTSGYRPHLYKGADYNSGGSTCIVMTSGSNSYGGNPNYVVMPGVTNDLSTLKLTFDVQMESATSGTLYVGYMTNPTDKTTFTQVATIQSNKGSRAEREVTFASFPTTGTVYVAFKWENSSSWYSCTIDNVVLSKGPDCPTPTNLELSAFQTITIGNNTMFTCDFSWADASNAGAYEYLWVPAGETPDWTSRTVSSTPYTYGNEVAPLAPSTTYDLYVRVNCTTGDGATTPAKLTFTTPCLPASLPYTENFDNMSAYSSMYVYNGTINEMYLPLCWIMPSNTYVSYSTTYDCTSHIYSGSSSNNNKVLALISGNSTTGGIAVLPDLPGSLSSMEILFTAKAYSSSSGTFELGYYANGTFTSLQRISNLSTSEFVQYQYKLSDLTGIANAPAGARLAFRMKYTSNSNSYYMLVDDIVVRLVPDCVPPTDLTAANITVSSATLSWTAGGDETSWFVAYGAPGFDPAAVANPTEVRANSLAISNLTDNTAYEFYVKANCSGLTYWAGPYAFRTACAATSVPWSEDFESTTFPPSDCWQNSHTAGDGSYIWARTTSKSHAGTAAAYVNDQSANTKTVLVTPLLNIPTANAYQVSFWMYRANDSYPKDNEGINVMVNTAPSSVNATSLLFVERFYNRGQMVEAAAGWYEYTVTIPTSGGVYVIFEATNQFGGSLYIDDISVTEKPSCEKPTAVSVAPVDGNSATVAWTAGGTETSWKVKWSTPAYADSAIVTTNPYTITNLTPQTAYLVMVKAICGENDESVYTDGVVCTTPCASITVTETTPYTEDFESYTASGYSTSAVFSLANCWSNVGAANYGPNIYNGTNYCAPTSGSNAFAMYNVYYSSDHGTIAILPDFTNALADLQVSFKYRMESSSSSQVMSIGYITNVNDENTYHALVTLPVSTSASEMNVILKTCGATLPAQANIAFKYYFSSSTTYVAWIDDIEVSLAPSCTEPANLAASEISTNAATITWTPTSGETTWKLAYGEEGFTPAQGTQVTDDSIQLTNLTPATTYDVYVKAICSADDETDWAGPVTFTTLCEPFVLTNNNVYLESFEGITSGVPGCWNNEEGTTTDASYKWTSYSTGYAGRCVRFNSSSNPSGKNNFLKSAALDLTQVSSAELSFYYNNQSNGDFSVYISTDGGTTHTTALSTNLTSDSEWELKTIDLTRFCGQGFDNVVIVFKSTSDYRSYYHYLDEVKVEPILPCVKPTNLAVSSITDNSVVLSWTAGDSETSWNVRYIAAGDTNYVNGVTTKPYTLTGLLDNTTYTFDVQADCGETDGLSVFSTSVTAKTKCSVKSLPYEENFNYADGRVIATSYSQTTSDLPDCWDYVYNATPSSYSDYKPRLYAGTYSPTSGDTSFLMNASASTSYSYYANNAMMIFPRLTGDLKDMYLTFDYTQGNSTAADAVLQLGYLTDASDASTFTLITALPHMYYSNGGRSLNNEYYLSDYMEQSVTNGVLAFRFVSSSTSTYWASVDNVKVMQAPACRQPNNIIATNITNNSAHLTWNANGNETGYLVSYHAVGGAPVDVMPTTNVVDLTGLTAQTTYEVEIMAACGNDGQSTVSNIYTFTTLCDPFVVAAGHPFTEDFNALNVNEGIPFCFDNSVGTTTNETYKWNHNTGGHNSTVGVMFNSSSNPSLKTNVLKTQLLDLSQATDGATLSFWCKYANTSTDTTKGRMDVYLYINGTDTIQLFNNIRNISTWTEYSYDISNYCGQGYNSVYVAFKGTSDYGLNGLYLDDIMVKANLPCHTPVASVSLVTNDAITYTWTALDNAVSYNIQYSDSLVAPGLGTIINTPNNSYTFSNLASGTVYYVYVQANCGVTDSLSEWISVPVTGQTTTCGAQTITEATPYIEDFSSYTANTSSSVSGGAQFPTCWNLTYNGTTSSDYSAHVYNGSYTPIASNNAVIMTATASTSSYSAYGNDACVSMPAFTNDYADLLLEFTTSMSTSSTDAVLSVGYMTNPYDNGTFVALTTVPNNYYSTAATRRADHQIYLRDYSNIPSGVYLAFKWHSNSTSSYYCCIDNVNVSIAPTCLAPNTISATNLTSNSVDMSWTSRYGETSWFYQYGLAGYDPEDPDARIEGFFIDSTSLPLHLEGLYSNTSYDFYLQSICGNDQSEYSDPYAFATLCEAITITESEPYEEGFERYTASGYGSSANFSLANCWNNAGAANYGPNIYNGTSWCRPTSGSNAFAMYTADSPKKGTIAILPGFTNSLADLQISFKYMMESDNTSQEMSLGYITDLNDENTYHPLVIIPIQKSAYVDMTVVLKEFRDSLPANANLAFKYYYNTSSTFVACIDDIEVSLGPACVAPNNIIATNTTDSSTIITWTSRDVETQWEIAYGPEDFDLSEGTVTNSDTVTITGLTASTAYDVYVRALCSEEDQSEWFGPYTFVTACAAQTLPYTEDFQSYQASSSVSTLGNAEFPLCWTTINSNTGGYVPHVYNGTSWINSDASNKCLSMVVGPSAGCNDVYTIMPAFTEELSRMELTFDYRLENSTYVDLHVGYITDPSDAATYTELELLPDHTGSYTTYTIDFSTYENIPANARIAFYANSDASSSFYSAGIDNISLGLAPDCGTPSDLAVSNITATTADVTWSTDTAIAAYLLTYRVQGDTTTQITDTVTAVPYTISGLVSDARYEVSVMPVCDGLAFPSAPVAFTTLCPAQSLPYTENFETYVASTQYSSSVADTVARWQAPSCWTIESTKVGTSFITPHVYKGSNYMPSGASKALVMGSGTDNYAVLPPFDDLSNVQILFKTAMYSTSYGTLNLGYMVNGTFTSLVRVPSNYYSNGYVQREYNLDEYTIPAGARLAFKWSYSSSSTYYICLLDDIIVREIPTCLTPTNVTATNATDASVVVSWLPTGDESQWEVACVPQGTQPTSGELVDTINAEITGLTASTFYDVYVRAYCSAENQSYWTMTPVTFTTECGVLSLPYSEDFENYTGAEYIAAEEGDDELDSWQMPLCWTTEETSYEYEEDYYYITYYSTPHIVNTRGEEGNALALDNVNSLNDFAYAALPLFDDLSNAEILFATGMYDEDEGTLELGYMSNGTFTSFVTVPNNDYRDGFVEHVYDLSTYTIPAGARLAFKWVAYDYSGYYDYYCLIDNVQVREKPDCETPSDLAVSNITSTTADVTWTVDTTVAAYVLTYHVQGDTSQMIDTVTAVPYTMTGLLSSSKYEVSVMPVCDGMAYPSDIVVFTTACDAMSLPYTEDFQSYQASSSVVSLNNSEFPLCWASINDNEAGYVPHVYNGTSWINSDASNKCLAMAVSETKGNVYAIMPAFTTELSRVELTFDYRLETTSERDVTLHVGYITDPSDYATYEELVQLPQQTGSYTTYSIDFSTYENIPANARIAFYAMGSNSTFYSAGIDNISLVPAPDCATPTDVVVNAGYNDATITWNEGEESAWTVYYHEAGDTNVTTVTTTVPTVTIPNLEPSTDYVVNVEVVCDGLTRPTADIAFTTQCAPYTITVDAPYTEDFGSYTASSDYYTAGVMADCWNAIYNGTSTGYAPHVFKSSSYSPTTNNKALSMVAAKNSTYYGQENYVVLPAFTNPLGDLKIEFATSMSNSDGQLSIGFIMDPTDESTYSTWENIPTNLNSSSSTRYASHTIYVYDYLEDYDIPEGSRIAFRWENTTSTSTSILGLDDIEVSLYQLYDTVSVTACDIYTDEDGNVYTETTSTITTDEGDEFIYNHVYYVEINHSVNDTIYETACDSLIWNDTVIYTSGEYVQYGLTADSCDSIVTLVATINNHVETSFADTACLSFTWNNVIYTESGDYTDTLFTETGCDSIVTLHLTILHGTYEAMSEQTCDTAYTWTWRGEDVVYTTSGTYTRYAEGDNGCQDTAVLNLTFYTPVTTPLTAQICEGETYTMYNFNVTEAGTYIDSLQTSNGCDSIVILTLTVGDRAETNLTAVICEGDDYTEKGFSIMQPAPGVVMDSLFITRQGSCDSVVYITLTVNPKTYGTDVVEACDSYTWIDGVTYTQSTNTPTTTLVNANGCDSIVTLDLTIYNSITTDDTQTACESYTWNNVVYTESGDYTDTLFTEHGCDSIVTLHLTINRATYATDVQTACNSYTWIDGVTYTASTDSAIYVTTNAAGCDSIITLNLTIHTSVTARDSITACDSYTWIDGLTYTESTYGEHIYLLTDADGCDSITILYLTINNGYYDTLHIDTCDSYTWTEGDGRTYRTSRVVTYTMTSANGCDSVKVLDLTINYTENTTDVVEACDSFTWIDGVTYTQSTNTPTWTLTSSHGCDSIITLDLTIYTPTNTVTNQSACVSYTWAETGETYTESGDYSVTYSSAQGCDSTITLHLVVYEMPVIEITGETEIHSGESATLTVTEGDGWNYAWSTGERTPEITVSPVETTTYTVIVSNGSCIANDNVTVTVITGLNNYGVSVDRIYPNPADEYCIVEAENMQMIHVFNMNGQKVSTYNVDNANSYRIETATFAPGVYFVKVITIDNRVMTAKFVVKH